MAKKKKDKVEDAVLNKSMLDGLRNDSQELVKQYMESNKQDPFVQNPDLVDSIVLDKEKVITVPGTEKKQEPSNVAIEPSAIIPDQGKEVVDSIKDQEDASGPKSQFLQALTFFAPQLIGTALGGAFEGTRGAVAGYEAGTGIQQILREEQAKLEKSQQAGKPSLKTFQQTQNVDTFDNSILLFDPNTGRYLRPDGSAPKGSVVEGSQVRFAQNLEEVRKPQLQLSFEKFGLDKQKVSQLSDKQVESLKSFDTSLQALDNMKFLKKSVNTGPVAGRAQSGLAAIGQSSPEFVDLRTEAENIKAEFLKAMSGAQVSDREAQRLANIIPNVNDDDATFDRKAVTFERIINRHQKSIADSISKGQPLKAIIINDFKNAAKDLNISEPNEYESIVSQARSEKDPAKRLQLLRQAKALKEKK